VTTLKPGSRWASATCTGEFVVVRPPVGEGVLTCGGAEVRALGSVEPGVEGQGGGEGTVAGKRYSEAESGFELLCTKAGTGDLAFDGRPLVRKDAKPLPASD
jgi:hypothetical protein